MENYLLLLIATILLALDFSLNKVYQRRMGASATAGLFFSTCNALFTALVFVAIKGLTEGFPIGFTPFSLLLAFLMGLCVLSYNVIGFFMLAKGKMAQYTLFLMIGGMTVPYVFGLIFLNETVSIFHILGLILIFCGVFCSNYQKGKNFDKKFLLMGIAVFFLNGAVSTLSKIHQIESVRATVSSSDFVLWAGLGRFFLCNIALASMGRKQEKKVFPAPPKGFMSMLPLILLSAVISGSSYLLQLIGAQNLPATVLYPCINGGSIIFSALAALLFFREKITRSMAVGILLCFAGVCCFL